MARYAKIESGEVVNVIVADPGAVAELPGTYVEIPTGVRAGPGWLYDGTDFTEPAPGEPEKRMRLSVREFREQFTAAEKQAIYTAAKSVIDIEVWLDDLRSVEWVDLDFQQTIDSVNGLEAASLIGTGRAAEILEGL